MTNTSSPTFLRTLRHRWIEWLVALILILVPLHAFLTVWGSTFVGHFTALRLWDEVGLGIVVVWSAMYLVRDKAVRRAFITDPIVRLIAIYCLLTVVLGAVALTKHEVSLKALGYALILNLRFLVWLMAVWLVAQRSDWLVNHWRKIMLIPLSIVVVFGLLQFFVLPHDFLMHFGYNDTHSSTYVDGLTLNQDSSILRVQSTLRGSNQLGGYLVASACLVLALLKLRHAAWRYWLLGLATVLTLFLTFSRSAWLGLIVALFCFAATQFKRIRWQYIWIAVAMCVALAIALVALRHSNTVQNLLLHKSSHSTAVVTSDQGHASALKSSLHDLVRQPFGGGPGSAGQASAYNNGHAARNTESYWLQIALELGWPGLLVLGAIMALTAKELWARRSSPLALGLVAGLVGLVVVNQFAYGWADDTLAYVWWGLAGIALAQKVLKDA